MSGLDSQTEESEVHVALKGKHQKKKQRSS